MQGTRLPDVDRDSPEGWERWERIKEGRGELIAPLGSYMKVLRKDGNGTWCWYLRSPAGDVCTIGWDLPGQARVHEITEHPDGTITVSPSIVFPRGGYHGFLQSGVWS